jgi:4-hydroxybenzoate polyprenyltransferase
MKVKYPPRNRPPNVAQEESSSIQSPYLVALRVHQWTKNLVIFAAPLFAFHWNWASIWGSILAFGLFCCVSSSFYLINDIVDVQSDRQHPLKCKRPIAAGLISIPVATAMAVALLAIALVGSGLQSPALAGIVLSYAILQAAYNIKLKRISILDIIVVAIGFVLRACAGAAATQVPVSPWFLLCTAMLALFLGIEKRKAELRLMQTGSGKTRSVLKHYSLPLLARMEGVVTTGAIMSYALWSAGPTVQGASTSWMLITLPFVLYGIFRYQMLSDPQTIKRNRRQGMVYAEQTERPDQVLLNDLPILATVTAWVLTSFVILWLEQQGVIQ